MGKMDLYFLLLPLAAVIALIFAGIKAKSVLKSDEGNDKMKSISASIRAGANAYLGRQYKTLLIFFAAVFALLLVMAFGPWKVELISKFTPFAFVTGGFFSALSGFFGMKIATAANARTANGAHHSLNKGLRIAFNAGTVMGFCVVGLALLDISAWFCLLKFVFKLENAEITSAMVTFGMGASSMALFGRVGGGIFTKAADVGADLVGKVEAGIPEDDPRNPAVIADNVGDNVGDVAGMGADLYESYVGSILSSLALAVAAFGTKATPYMLVPILVAAFGVVASIIGTFFVKTKEKASSKQLLSALRKGTYVSTFLLLVGALGIVKLTGASWRIYFAIVFGILTGVLIGFFTEYYTSDSYKPTRKLSDSATTGSATVIIDGIALGMRSTLLPILIIAASVIASYTIVGGIGGDGFTTGLYGIGVSAVAMLSTLGISLATDAYGPVADNAGGIAEMSELGEEVRERTDALDALGNTTAATGKGFAIGSAALTALALIASFIDRIGGLGVDTAEIKNSLTLTNPYMLIGLFIGGMLPFLFTALTMSSVGKSAHSIVLEVRRQFKEIKGIMDGTGKPDYAKCVELCTKSALHEMMLPAIITVLSPIVVGLILGYAGVAGMLAGATVSGFCLAVMMSNAGGAWDNAKKYIESGHGAGKGSEEHKAAVVGDTVGDPFKDTSGPAINILIKLLSVVSIVVAALIVNVHIF